MAEVLNLKRSLSTKDEQRYQVISRAAIRLFAGSKGHNISDDAVRMLTEDVNYRLRELVSVSYMHYLLIVRNIGSFTGLNGD